MHMLTTFPLILCFLMSCNNHLWMVVRCNMYDLFPICMLIDYLLRKYTVIYISFWFDQFINIFQFESQPFFEYMYELHSNFLEYSLNLRVFLRGLLRSILRIIPRPFLRFFLRLFQRLSLFKAKTIL